MRINKYGLKDTIPSSVKREVRQRCGFGCVNCGNAVYQYEHLDPTFAEAREHNPRHIVLLCGGCHDRVTRKILSKETIKIRSINPACKQKGFSFGPFDLGLVEPTIKLGTLICKDVESLINIDGESVFSVKKPECSGSPFRINAYLTNLDGREILQIVDNEWVTSTSNWDVEIVGAKIMIRKNSGNISLVLRSEAPHTLTIERLEMMHHGVKISCRENEDLKVVTRNGQTLSSSSMSISGCKVGLDISEHSLSVGVGGGCVEIGNMEISHQSAINHYPISFNRIPKIIKTEKVGRNHQCPCDSGQKYKRCCGRI